MDPYESNGLREYLNIIKRGWWLVPLTTLVLAGGSYLLSAGQAKVFEASSSVFLNFQNVGSSLAEVGAVYQDPVRGIETQANIAQLPAVRERAAKLVNRPVGSLGSVVVAPANNADILVFTVSDGDPADARDLATAYARAYTDYRREIDTAAIVAARKGVETQLAQLRAEGNNRGEYYGRLQEKLQQLETAEALQASNAQLVRRASSAVQTAPNPPRNAILAGILGLILGIALVFGRNALNTRVRSVDEVRERLRLPLIARIPYSRAMRKAGDGIVMLQDPHAPTNEAFRMMAINLDVANIDRGARSIMVTSAHRGEGKSTTIANLAVANARRGHHVILVDLDLRAPAVGRRFGLDGPGVTDVALGTTSLEDALVDIPLLAEEAPPGAPGLHQEGQEVVGKLEVLTSGPLPPNAYEFLASPATSNLLTRLTERADLVLVDAPPILRVSDALSLASRVDSLFVVVRVPRIGRRTLDELKRVIDSAPTIQLGFVATGKLEEDDYGYGYGYGHGYGYGYGYGATQTAPEPKKGLLKKVGGRS